MPPKTKKLRAQNATDLGVQQIEERDWRTLLKQIRKGTCVPFLGPDLTAGVYPSKADIAQRWAEEEDYPFEDRSDLARVAQFLAVQNAPSYPVEKLVEELEAIERPDFSNRNEPYRILAELPLPLYITTNYDNSMRFALEKLPSPRDAQQDTCSWRHAPAPPESSDDDKPLHPAKPLIFHMFGHIDEPDSLVLTEHDYLKFLINVSRHEFIVPALIQGAIAEGSLMFMGYRFNDWDFRVLAHIIATYLEGHLGKVHVSVVTPEYDREAAVYLKLYFRRMDLRVFKGTSFEFISKLRKDWEVFSNVPQT